MIGPTDILCTAESQIKKALAMPVAKSNLSRTTLYLDLYRVSDKLYFYSADAIHGSEGDI